MILRMHNDGAPTDSGQVIRQVDNGIARIEFGHPKANSLPSALLHQLREAFLEAGQDDSVRVIVLSSQGEGAFCAGASFQELQAAQTQEAATEFFMGFVRLIEAMVSCPRIVVCRVQGKSVGGGVGLVAACDYAVAHQSASIRLSELAIGLGPFVIGPCLERKIGAPQLAAMSLDSLWRDAAWACRHGLFASVHASHQALDSCLDDLLSSLSESSRPATQQLKQALWGDVQDWGALLRQRARISGSLAVHPTTRKMIQSLLEK